MSRNEFEFCVKNKFSPKGNYEVFIYPINENKSDLEQKNESLEEMAQTFMNQLEGLVRKYPQNWFNFYNVWKN